MRKIKPSPLEYVTSIARLPIFKVNRLMLVTLHEVLHAESGCIAGKELLGASSGALHLEPGFSAGTFLSQASLKHRVRVNELPASKAIPGYAAFEIGSEL